MSDFLSKPCTAFEGPRCIASGALVDVALAAKAAVQRNPAAPVLTFDDATGAVVDLDLRGTTAEIVSRLAEQSKVRPQRRSEPATDATDANARGRGRPKLGVVAREVSLLPRHWEWLASPWPYAFVVLGWIPDGCPNPGRLRPTTPSEINASHRVSRHRAN